MKTRGTNSLSFRDANVGVRFRLIVVAFVAAVLMVWVSVGFVSQAQAEDLSHTYIQDNYGVMSESEKANYEQQAAQLAQTYGCGVYYVTVADIGSKSARDYAKSYYKSNSLGLGDSSSGIMFLVAVKSRDYVTITYGNATTPFSDYAIEQLETAVVDKLSDNKFVDACGTYISQANTILSFYASNGTPLEKSNDPSVDNSFPLKAAIVIGLIVGLIAAALLLRRAKAKMKTAREKTEASDYFDFSETKIKGSNDRFVTTTRVVVDLHKDDNSHGGSTIDSGGFGGSGGGKF